MVFIRGTQELESGSVGYTNFGKTSDVADVLHKVIDILYKKNTKPQNSLLKNIVYY